MPSPASSAAATQAEERGDQPKVEADAQAAAPDPSQLARRWFAGWAERSFAARARELKPVPSEPRVGEELLRITPASDIAATWGALMAELARKPTEARASAEKIIDERERVSALEARILRFNLARGLIAVDQPEAARELLLKALPTAAPAPTPAPVAAEDPKTARPASQAAAPSAAPSRLDFEVLRALAATHRFTDGTKCAAYLRSALDTYRRLPGRAQVVSSPAVWNAALVLSNVLSESGAHAEAADLLEWVYGDLRIERTLNEERGLMLMKIGYSEKAGRSAECLADCAWLVVHAPEWVWGSSDYASLPHRAIQDAVAAELLTFDQSLELLASLSYEPAAVRQPAALAQMAYACLIFSPKLTDAMIARSEEVLKLLLSAPRPDNAREAAQLDSALKTLLSGLAFVYRGDGGRGVPARPAELERVKAIWKERFPGAVLEVS
jgi:hypothetical protein